MKFRLVIFLKLFFHKDFMISNCWVFLFSLGRYVTLPRCSFRIVFSKATTNQYNKFLLLHSNRRAICFQIKNHNLYWFGRKLYRQRIRNTILHLMYPWHILLKKKKKKRIHNNEINNFNWKKTSNTILLEGAKQKDGKKPRILSYYLPFVWKIALREEE